MIVILSAIILAIGLWQLISPRVWLNVILGRENEEEDIALAFKIFCRISGAFCTVAGLAGLIVTYM